MQLLIPLVLLYSPMPVPLLSSIVCLLLAGAILWSVRWWADHRTTVARVGSPLTRRGEGRCRQRAGDLTQSKRPDWEFLVLPERRRGAPNCTVHDLLFGAALKSDVAREGRRLRSDWLYYNNDAGDLTDPYRSRAGVTFARTQPAARKLY